MNAAWYRSRLLAGAIASFAVFLGMGCGGGGEKPALAFRAAENGRLQFKILQLADLHFGEAAWDDWGPEQDLESIAAMKAYFEAEADVDLVVLSGDQITSNNIDANATVYYHMILDVLKEANVKWASIFGNHDVMPHIWEDEQGELQSTPAKHTRRGLARVDMSYESSYTQEGAEATFGMPGTSNYFLPLLEGAGGEEAARIYFFDSGGGEIPERNNASQVEWFNSTSPERVPAVAFQHIPPSRPAYAFEDASCFGQNAEGGLSPVEEDEGVLSSLAAAGVHFLSVGHNHGNDYCCTNPDYGATHLCFGKHSGYGGYGEWERGAKIYLLELDSETRAFSWSSYIRMDNGTITSRSPPQGFVLRARPGGGAAATLQV